MTESEWLAATGPYYLNRLFRFLEGRTSRRKALLFVAACMARIISREEEPVRSRGMGVVERLADGVETDGDREALQLAPEPWRRFANQAIGDAVRGVSNHVVRRVIEITPLLVGGVCVNELRRQVGLIHHLAGNPFRPAERPDHMPRTVLSLATGLYAGQDGAFALRDALLEAGAVELADHFTQADHPKGCWALDCILGKS
jgi:hypothetical protein